MVNSRYKLKTGEEVAYFPPIQNTDSPYASEAAMHADQGNQLEGYGYLVTDVGAFIYLGTVAGTAADYEASNIAHPLVETAVPVGALFTDTIYDDTEILSQIEISRSNISYGEAYISNYRNSVLNDGATFFPSDAGYEVGKLKESGVMNDCPLLLLPSAVKAGTLYSVKPQDRSGDFTVDRNSTATYIDEDGLIKTALANVPRIDWSTGEAALLVEPQSTNLIPYSEDFSQWRLTSGNLTTSNGKIYENTQDEQHFLRIDSNVGVGTYTQFVFIKDFELTSRYIALYPQGSAINGFVYVIFNLNDDRVTKKTSNIEGRIYNKGQYKVLEIVHTTIAVGDWNSHLYFSNTPTIPSYIYVGDSSKFIEVVGFQLEEGTEATSYIHTAGVTETRLADNISVPTPAGVTSIIETIEGVEQTPITTIPATYSLPVGNINKVTMI